VGIADVKREGLEGTQRLEGSWLFESFASVLANSHNISATRSALKTEEKDQTIFCFSKRGSFFHMTPPDVSVHFGFHPDTQNGASLGLTYTNNT
jgi:hypothetical protein